MRASSPRSDTALCLDHLELSFRHDDVLALRESYAAADLATASAILDGAADFAAEILEPLNDAMDRKGVTLVDGAVRTASGHREAWQAFVAAGWPGMDHAAEHGGQQMPLALCLAAQEIFDRACPAFGMLPVPQRSAARLIAAFGDEVTKAALLPGLASGGLGATICVSEAGAGSDLAQIRTRAAQAADGTWRLTGEKCWISFGDHDLTGRVVHCVLARTDEPGAAAPEISLFLVEGGRGQPGAVLVRRVEEKLGLHGSPTCALGFEGAAASLLGQRGRGLAQMFVMITQMRLAVGAMGLGIAGAAGDTALAYARDRRQGGKPGAPVPIIEHPDVQRQVMEMISRTEMLRGLLLNTANLAEIAAHSRDAVERTEIGALVQWLLPIIKTFGAHAAFANASDAIQVLGGAGYTRDWPVEQMLRDARVLSVFEGTSGIQALDLVHRRTIRDRAGLDAFLALARTDGAGTALIPCLDLLAEVAARFARMDGVDGDIEAGASAFLELAILAAAGWTASRLARLNSDTPARRRISEAAEYWLVRIGPRATLAHAEALAGRTGLPFG
jgi:alkylation response protein AidB-like acyl-CoA dehydrogenase